MKNINENVMRDARCVKGALARVARAPGRCDLTHGPNLGLALGQGCAGLRVLAETLPRSRRARSDAPYRRGVQRRGVPQTAIEDEEAGRNTQHPEGEGTAKDVRDLKDVKDERGKQKTGEDEHEDEDEGGKMREKANEFANIKPNQTKSRRGE